MKKLASTLLIGLTAATLTLSGCVSVAKIGTVNGQPITKAEYDKTYKEFSQGLQLEGKPKAQQALYTDLVKQMTLNKLIIEALIHGEAEKAGIKITDADVADFKEKNIFKDPKLKAEYETMLKKQQIKQSDLDDMIRENLMLTRLVEKQAGADVKVTEADAKAIYDQHVNQFKLPERIQASHILVKAIVPELKQEVRTQNPKIKDTELEATVNKLRAERKAKAEKLFAEVKAHPDQFKELARKNSDDKVSGENGGDLGEMQEGTVDPTFWAAAEKTPDGKLYPGVVDTQFGFHIIQVAKHLPARQESFAEVKTRLMDELGQQKKQAFLHQWLSELKEKATIDIADQYEPESEKKKPQAEAAADMKPEAKQPEAASSAPAKSAH